MSQKPKYKAVSWRKSPHHREHFSDGEEKFRRNIAIKLNQRRQFTYLQQKRFSKFPIKKLGDWTYIFHDVLRLLYDEVDVFILNVLSLFYFECCWCLVYKMTKSVAFSGFMTYAVMSSYNGSMFWSYSQFSESKSFYYRTRILRTKISVSGFHSWHKQEKQDLQLCQKRKEPLFVNWYWNATYTCVILENNWKSQIMFETKVS